MTEESGFEDATIYSQIEDIEHVASEGATCRCHVVRHHGKRMFMKHTRVELSDNVRYVEAFKKEFEIGFNLDHPNIIRYYSLGEDAEGIFMLTEYIEGGTLSEICHDNPEYFSNADNVMRLLTQLLDALQHIHSHQVLHLDLKPDNLLLTKVSHNLKIIDFGFSYSDEFDTTMGSTSSFASPEQKAKTKTYDCRTDIYAIGLIVRYICEQCKTKNASTLLAFADRCTKQEPADRFQNTQEAIEWINRTTSKRRHLKWACIVSSVILFCAISIYAIHQTSYFHDNKKSVYLPPYARTLQTDATEQEVAQVMDSVFTEIYSPMRHLWKNKGVDADCRSLTVEERLKAIDEVRDFNEQLQSFWEDELQHLTKRFPKHRVYIYKNYKLYTHPAEADSLDKWYELAKALSL